MHSIEIKSSGAQVVLLSELFIPWPDLAELHILAIFFVVVVTEGDKVVMVGECHHSPGFVPAIKTIISLT